MRHAHGAVGAAPPAAVIEYDPYLVGTVVPPNPPGLPPTTRVSGGPRADKGRTPAVASGPEAGVGLRQAVSTVLASSVNENSRTTYDSSWKTHWAAWTVLRGIPLYLDGANPRADEEELFNVVFFREGAEVTGEAIQTADEVVLMQGASKTDPNGQGSVANAFEAPGNELCLLSLLKRALRMNPKLFASPDSFLRTRSDGRVLHRDVVAKHLSEAAVAKGAPQGAASVISTRSGGASAMWDAGMSSEEIKRRGRWSSDCYQIYIWPGHDRGRDVASKMLGSSFSLMASLAAYRRHGK